MEKVYLKNSPTSKILVVFSVFMFVSCTTVKWDVPSGYIGKWKTDAEKITVRTHSKGGYQFTSDSAVIVINIGVDKTVSGTIGFASFQNGSLERNSGNPDITGVAYIIRCGHIGKIFKNDPLETKEVEIWLSPLKEKMNSELRYTEGLAVFPMGELIFTKQ